MRVFIDEEGDCLIATDDALSAQSHNTLTAAERTVLEQALAQATLTTLMEQGEMLQCTQ